MANWCVGNLKVRGTPEAVVRFFRENIEGCSADFNDYGDIEITGLGDQAIKRMYRVYCNSKSNEIYEFYPHQGKVIAIIPIEVAWYLPPEGLCELSQEFEVDFRFYGFECGQEFNQELEIIEGKVTMNKKIKFGDYKWECVFPAWGGER